VIYARAMNTRHILLLCLSAMVCLAPDCFPGDCDCFEHGGIASEITDDHGHVLEVPAEDFTDPVDGTYDITGEADHSHEVSFTGEQLEVVSGYNSATEESTVGDGHTHMVTLDCSCI